jgi:hypothetical protein
MTTWLPPSRRSSQLEAPLSKTVWFISLLVIFPQRRAIYDAKL